MLQSPQRTGPSQPRDDRMLQKTLAEFLLSRCYFELERLLLEPVREGHFGLFISLMELMDYNCELGWLALRDPGRLLETEFDAAIQIAIGRFTLAYHQPNLLSLPKPLVHARLHRLPQSPWTFFELIPTSSSLGRLVSVRGTVVRTGSVRMLERWKEWECSRCKHVNKSFADDTAYGTVPRPVVCSGSVDGLACKGTKFIEIETASSTAAHAVRCDDYQEIKIQELTSVLEVGAVPRSLLVLLRHDLVDVCKAGEDVIVTGVLGWRSRPFRTRCDGELFLSATSVMPSLSDGTATSALSSSTLQSDQCAVFERFWSQFRTPEERLNARNLIVSSFCPQIYGMHLVKLAVLMTVIGGSGVNNDNEGDVNEAERAGRAEDLGYEPATYAEYNEHRLGPQVQTARRSRKEGHLLLVGDPGTAKSQFLVNAARLCSRSVMTTGSGATNAGLTVAAVKDASDWQLEAGALVMADRGICCIDEFNGLRPQDRTAIHEAMEQQTLSVAKAGLVCKLNTRCSVIAACNAKGTFEEGRSITANVALASPLLSRFDLILILLDHQKRSQEPLVPSILPEPEPLVDSRLVWDRKLCDKILSSVTLGNLQRTREEAGVFWDWDVLRSYVTHLRSSLNPQLSSVAEALLSRYYQHQRRLDTRQAARTTVRLLESLVRLAQAHAKLMYQRVVELRDAIVAIVFMEASLWSNTESLIGREHLDLFAEAEGDSSKAEAVFSSLEREILLKLEVNPDCYPRRADAMMEGNGMKTANTMDSVDEQFEESDGMDELLEALAATNSHSQSKDPHGHTQTADTNASAQGDRMSDLSELDESFTTFPATLVRPTWAPSQM